MICRRRWRGCSFEWRWYLVWVGLISKGFVLISLLLFVRSLLLIMSYFLGNRDRAVCRHACTVSILLLITIFFALGRCWRWKLTYLFPGDIPRSCNIRHMFEAHLRRPKGSYLHTSELEGIAFWERWQGARVTLSNNKLTSQALFFGGGREITRPCYIFKPLRRGDCCICTCWARGSFILMENDKVRCYVQEVRYKWLVWMRQWLSYPF